MTGARPRADDRSKAAERVAAHRASGRGVTRIPYTIGIREATVLRRSWVTDRMVRLTFGGPGLDGTHTYAADDHVKLLFPDADGELRLRGSRRRSDRPPATNRANARRSGRCC